MRFPEVEGSYLALWHGFTVPLLLTGVIIGAGALMFWQRDVVATAQFERPALGDADDVWDNIIRTLRIAALRLAGLILGPSTDIRMIVWDSPWQGMTVMFMSLIAVAATLQRNRLSGVIMVRLTGFSLALIFALHGAPDLALTQVLVETIVMVVFMLGLRKSPPSWKTAVTRTYACGPGCPSAPACPRSSSP